MEKKPPQSNTTGLFMHVAIAWIIFLGWSAHVMAIFGFFHRLNVIILFAISTIWLIVSVYRKKLYENCNFGFVLAVAVSLAAVILYAQYVTPSVFSGRDQGSMSEAAIRLSQNHRLEFSTPASEAFFKFNKPGKALNFPGFAYTSSGMLTTQFPIPYTAWCAMFFSVFGLTGFAIANAVLLFFFFIALYLLIKTFSNTYAAMAGLLFAVTSFAFSWFSKYTLTENMALPLLWIMILAAVAVRVRHQTYLLAAFVASGTLLVFTRIEGIILFAIACLLLSWSRPFKRWLATKRFWPWPIIATALALIAVVTIWKDIYYYREIAKAVFAPLISSSPDPSSDVDLPGIYMGQLFYAYGMLAFFVVGFAGIITAFLHKRFSKFIPLAIVIPTAIYLIDSNITPDHPWMLRRFVFSLLPAMIFYSSIGLYIFWNFFSDRVRPMARIVASTVAVLLLLSNIPALAGYLTFSENKGLLEQTKDIAGRFGGSDLVLVDRLATGSGWDMITGPASALFGKQTVYFFNLDDISKIDRSAFSSVYLIAPDSRSDFYRNSVIGGSLSPAGKYSISTRRLAATSIVKNKTVIAAPIEKIDISGTVWKIENRQTSGPGTSMSSDMQK